MSGYRSSYSSRYNNSRARFPWVQLLRGLIGLTSLVSFTVAKCSANDNLVAIPREGDNIPDTQISPKGFEEIKLKPGEEVQLTKAKSGAYKLECIDGEEATASVQLPEGSKAGMDVSMDRNGKNHAGNATVTRIGEFNTSEIDLTCTGDEVDLTLIVEVPQTEKPSEIGLGTRSPNRPTVNLHAGTANGIRSNTGNATQLVRGM